MTSEAVRWLEEKFDSCRIPSGNYLRPTESSCGIVRPIFELIEPEDECCSLCRLGLASSCRWIIGGYMYRPSQAASSIHFDLPWTAEHERRWLEAEDTWDAALDKRIRKHRESGKEA